MAKQVSFEEWWKQARGSGVVFADHLCRASWDYQQLTIDAQAKKIAELEQEIADGVEFDKDLTNLLGEKNKQITELEAKVKELEQFKDAYLGLLGTKEPPHDPR